MTVLVVAACGALVAGGAFVLLRSLTGTVIEEPAGDRPARRLGSRFDRVGARALSAGLSGALVLIMTGWPVGTILAVSAGFLGPSLLGGRSEREWQRARLEAIATWTEQLRDVMAAASGLEQAIITTAPVAPVAIRPLVLQLSAGLETGTAMRSSLRRFASQLDDAAGDLVVAALILASDGSPRQLGDLLSRLAATVRDDVKMRLRIEMGRARTRSSVKVVSTVTIAFSFGLVILNPEYVTAYRSPTGQAVLVCVAALFAGAYWWLARAGRPDSRGRFLGSDDDEVMRIEEPAR